MKKLIIAMAALLVLSLAFNAWVIYIGVRYTDEINKFASVNFALSNQLLFDGLQRDTIDVYVWHTNTPQTFDRSGYTIRVIPLPGDDTRLTLGNSNFLYHSTGRAFMYACHVWDTDRDLAMFLLNLLSGVESRAAHLMDEINPDGSLTPAGQKLLESEQSQYEWRLKEYGPLQTTSIEHVVPPYAPQAARR